MTRENADAETKFGKGIIGLTGKRLAKMAEILPATDRLADIGTDHGHLLTSLVLSQKIRRGIGVEIARGPYERAQKNVADLGLEDRIEIRLGDGLGALAPGEATACVIAGMGGQTIIDILDRRPQVAATLPCLLLQPMSAEAQVRHYLQQTNRRITDEALVEERGTIYLILLARRGKMKRLSPSEAEFGPLLLAERPPLFSSYVRVKTDRLAGIIDRLERSDSEESRLKQSRLKALVEEWSTLL